MTKKSKTPPTSKEAPSDSAAAPLREDFQPEALSVNAVLDATPLTADELDAISEQVKLCASLLEKIDEYRRGAMAQIEKQDRITLDILHAIEFDDHTKIVGSQQYVKELKRCRTLRRKAKDTVSLIDALKKDLKSDTGSCENVNSQIKLQQDRTYFPRERPELFDEIATTKK